MINDKLDGEYIIHNGVLSSINEKTDFRKYKASLGLITVEAGEIFLRKRNHICSQNFNHEDIDNTELNSHYTHKKIAQSYITSDYSSESTDIIIKGGLYSQSYWDRIKAVHPLTNLDDDNYNDHYDNEKGSYKNLDIFPVKNVYVTIKNIPDDKGTMTFDGTDTGVFFGRYHTDLDENSETNNVVTVNFELYVSNKLFNQLITDINLAKDIKINIITKLFRHESFEDTLVLDSSWLHSNLFATLSEINYSTHLNSAITNNKNNEDDCDNNENDTEPSNIEVLTKEIKEHAYSADHGIWALKKTADNILASTSYQWLQIAILGLIAWKLF
ncbi:hypothetical protein NB069_08800 [Leclercia adecarboxylata]|uniref:hypothetical protein n=1 Tax=Leclercia adecarboxylata TaxID=83655 RepID=UPI00202A9869|nr:hypothetical protein [Leclercia adecarboxylata]URO00947.1 hypothetical protein NB069_08800 [Leclercia adecarboxylata]